MTRLSVAPPLVLLELDEVELGILNSLAGELAGMLRGGDGARDDADPVIARLLPDAYPDDAEAAAEFRRFTADDLAGRKAANAELLAVDAGAGSPIELDAASGDRWLRSLTDLRLALASRLGIVTDDDGAPDDTQGAVYQWLGELQWRLVDALDELADATDGGADAARTR